MFGDLFSWAISIIIIVTRGPIRNSRVCCRFAHIISQYVSSFVALPEIISSLITMKTPLSFFFLHLCFLYTVMLIKLYSYRIKHRWLQIFILSTNNPKMEQHSEHKAMRPSMITLPPARTFNASVHFSIASVFIPHTYHMSNKMVMLIIYLDWDSDPTKQ